MLRVLDLVDTYTSNSTYTSNGVRTYELCLCVSYRVHLRTVQYSLLSGTPADERDRGLEGISSVGRSALAPRGSRLANMGESAYSYSLTTFSPSGKLVQIEYALSAVTKAP